MARTSGKKQRRKQQPTQRELHSPWLAPASFSAKSRSTKPSSATEIDVDELTEDDFLECYDLGSEP